jgi:hypothetical protein
MSTRGEGGEGEQVIVTPVAAEDFGIQILRCTDGQASDRRRWHAHDRWPILRQTKQRGLDRQADA